MVYPVKKPDSAINDFALYIVWNPFTIWVPWIKFWLYCGTTSFVQLATIRARAWQYQKQLSEIPYASVAMHVPWDETGYEWGLHQRLRYTCSQSLLRHMYLSPPSKSGSNETAEFAVRKRPPGLPMPSDNTGTAGSAMDNCFMHGNMTDCFTDMKITERHNVVDELSSIDDRKLDKSVSTPDDPALNSDARTSPSPTLDLKASGSPPPVTPRRDFTPPKPAKLRHVTHVDEEQPENSTVFEFRDYGKQFDRPDLPDGRRISSPSDVDSNSSSSSSRSSENPTQTLDTGQAQDTAPAQLYPSIPPANERPLYRDASSDLGVPLVRARKEQPRPSPREDIGRGRTDPVGPPLSPVPRRLWATQRRTIADRPVSRRLGSSELIPDRYLYESTAPIPAAPSLVETSTDVKSEEDVQTTSKPRFDSLVKEESDKTNNCERLPLSSITEISQRDKGRRAAAASDSDVSFVSSKSTDSSRARKALAYTLDTDKHSWSPVLTKSNASVGFSLAGGAFKNLVNLSKPTGSKSLAEELTTRLSKRCLLSPSKETATAKVKEKGHCRMKSISDTASEKSRAQEI